LRNGPDEAIEPGGRRKDFGGRSEGGFAGHGDEGLLADIRESVTNEAILCENTIMAENHQSVDVTANSAAILGLDKVPNEPREGRAEEMLSTEKRGRRSYHFGITSRHA
jgi:hypothetical protein